MKEHSFIGQRLIQDYVRHVGGIKEVKITPKLLSYASQARQRYHSYLDKEKLKRPASASVGLELEKKKKRFVYMYNDENCNVCLS